MLNVQVNCNYNGKYSFLSLLLLPLQLFLLLEYFSLSVAY